MLKKVAIVPRRFRQSGYKPHMKYNFKNRYGCYTLETNYRNLVIFSFFSSLLAFKTPQDHFIFKCCKFYFSLFGEISPVRKSAAHWVGEWGIQVSLFLL
jgi:hypothetical protein